MSLDLLVQVAVTSKGGAPTLDGARDARLKLRASLLFVDGKKLGPLKTLEQATFEQLDAWLMWIGGPSAHIRFPEAKSLEILKVATEAAQKRALKAAPPEGTVPVRAVQLTGETSIGTPPHAHAERRRPLLDCGSEQKRPIQLVAEHIRDGKEEQDAAADLHFLCTPIAAVVDTSLSEADRQKRRRLAAECAHDRVAQSQTRGIGDVSAAQRMQDRVEREELIGRITEKYTRQHKELPWNIGGAPLVELREHLKSLARKKVL